MLQVDLRELARGPVQTAGELAENDPIFAGLDFVLTSPVRVRGRLHAAGEGRFYWDARLSTQLVADCRRCLTRVTLPLEAAIGALFVQGPEAEDDPEAYPVRSDALAIDLIPAVREELILATPHYVLCREDCRGLCPRCGHDLNAGPCGCAPAADARWAALEALKEKHRG
jgi:uncharacterized protein